MRGRLVDLRLPLIPLWLPIGVALILRFPWAGIATWRRGVDAFLVPDSHGYLELARSVMARGEFAGSHGVPELFRTRDIRCC